jgi:predicted esterase
MATRSYIALWVWGLSIAPSGLAQDRIEKKVHPEAKPVLAFLPKVASPGLIVGLHGTGGSGPGFAGSFPLAKICGAGYIVAFPTSIQGAWSTAQTNGTPDSRKKDLDHLKALFDTFTREFAVHPDKIHFIGFSAGGMMSCQATAVAPELDGYRIRSVCAHSGGFGGPPAKPSRAKETSVWVLNGSLDSGHAASSKTMCEMFQKAGYDARYQEVPGKGHVFPLVPFDEILAWWQKLDRDAPDLGRIRASLDRGRQELNRKSYGSAYRSFEDAKKEAAGKAERLLKEAEEGLASIEREARRSLEEAESKKEKDPAAAQKILKEMTTRFARTPYADEAKKRLAELK